MSEKRIRLRMGQLVLCGKCGEDRHFGYGPCRHCGFQPTADAVDKLRRDGIVVDENGKVVRK